ncbi:hypothetical protein EB75_08190 [Mycobacterium sp. ST-F2]|uniref:TetR/AcrR family transcriptional regulator n=1 Tax=Mycobacterium sp. ST-F2 TaxID=1490484 RepID=UPI000939BF51|nr:TetR/AcrR family transcriptional regulator [Mycobacterium sp. ST-F2]OKH83552.1 hypothetical protein EB75_08190 [Mycobacterium sp. ST-F2]
MAVAFSPDERDSIARALVDTAERLFATQGLKKTSLDELVRPAGIGKGSFYAFFDSKESLYLEVMLRRAPRVGSGLAAPLSRPVDEDGLVGLMRGITDVLVDDPFYRRLLTHPDELTAVTRRVGPDQLARVMPQIVSPVLDYLAAGQRAGVLVDDIAPDALLGVMRSVGLLVMNRDRFGAGYDDVLDATIRTLARGMLR